MHAFIQITMGNNSLTLKKVRVGVYKLLTRLLQRISLFCNESSVYSFILFLFFYIYYFYKLLINSCKVKTVEVEQQKAATI